MLADATAPVGVVRVRRPRLRDEREASLRGGVLVVEVIGRARVVDRDVVAQQQASALGPRQLRLTSDEVVIVEADPGLPSVLPVLPLARTINDDGGDSLGSFETHALETFCARKT